MVVDKLLVIVGTVNVLFERCLPMVQMNGALE